MKESESIGRGGACDRNQCARVSYLAINCQETTCNLCRVYSFLI